MPPQPDQVRCPTYEFPILPGRDRFPEFGTGSKFFNDFSRARAHTRVRAREGPFGLRKMPLYN